VSHVESASGDNLLPILVLQAAYIDKTGKTESVLCGAKCESVLYNYVL